MRKGVGVCFALYFYPLRLKTYKCGLNKKENAIRRIIEYYVSSGRRELEKCVKVRRNLKPRLKLFLHYAFI